MRWKNEPEQKWGGGTVAGGRGTPLPPPGMSLGSQRQEEKKQGEEKEKKEWNVLRYSLDHPYRHHL